MDSTNEFPQAVNHEAAVVVAFLANLRSACTVGAGKAWTNEPRRERVRIELTRPKAMARSVAQVFCRPALRFADETPAIWARSTGG